MIAIIAIAAVRPMADDFVTVRQVLSLRPVERGFGDHQVQP
jgi:hypothetical protein